VILALPIVIPLITAALSLLAWRAPRVQKVFALSGALSLLTVSLVLFGTVWSDGILTVQIGGWAAPYGITLVCDLLSALMLIVTGVIGVCIVGYSIVGMEDRQEAFGYYALVHVLLMGVCGAFLTGDIFNLYVWFEVMLIASFVLLALGGERAQMEGALKYVAINLLSSAIFLAAVGLLYGATGTLNMADLAMKLRTAPPSGLITALSMLFLVTFGVKAAIFPLFFWLPASYPTPPVAVSALFAGLLTKVGVYSLIRVFTLIFVRDLSTDALFLVVAGFTMVTGVLGAMSQHDFRRILSFDIVSQVGYMLLGLGIGTRLALAGSLYLMVHNMLVKTNLFLISGVCRRILRTDDIRLAGGLYKSAPALSIFFLISAMAVAGLPPLPGFIGKFALVKAGLETRHDLIAGVALVTSFFTLFAMTRIWGETFWKPAKPFPAPAQSDDFRKDTRLLQVPIALLAGLTMLLGIGAGPALSVMSRAADQLLQPEEYIRAVLGEQP
jgi:multicomponent Na+:H+ antiporter subunit D